MPFSEQQRIDLAGRLTAFALEVDEALRAGGDIADPIVRDYVRGVERAASDLGARKARHLALMAVCVNAIGHPEHPNLSSLPDIAGALGFADLESDDDSEDGIGVDESADNSIRSSGADGVGES